MKRVLGIVLSFGVAATVCAGVEAPTELDAGLQRIRDGATLDEAEQRQCNESLSRYCAALCAQHGTSVNYDIPEPDRTRFYVAAIKAAIIDPVENGGWPFRSELRLFVLDELKVMIKEKDDPFLLFCAVFPALAQKDVEYAAGAYETLTRRDAFLSRLTVQWTVDMYHKPGWFVDHCLVQGEQGKALAFADAAVATGKKEGFMLKARLLTRTGELGKAEACYKEIFDRFGDIGSLVAFYMECGDETDDAGVTLRQHYEELTRQCFPNGLRKVDRDHFSGPPTAGVLIKVENPMTQGNGLRVGMVIAAQDGYPLENLTQYRFVRQLGVANKTMVLVVWDGGRYIDVPVRLDSGLGTLEYRDGLADYRP